jgi:hypothetical protein
MGQGYEPGPLRYRLTFYRTPASKVSRRSAHWQSIWRFDLLRQVSPIECDALVAGSAARQNFETARKSPERQALRRPVTRGADLRLRDQVLGSPAAAEISGPTSQLNKVKR